jgi:glucose/arabinose dehydrogenase
VDEYDRVHVVESGYSYGEVFTTPRLLRLEPDGQLTVVAAGRNNGPWTGGSYHQGAFYISEGGELEGGRILRITPDGQITVLVEDLPSRGDHHTNRPVVGPDGYVYFGVGTYTNSGVVGPDNYFAGWLKRHPELHDIPGQDIVLTGHNHKSHNPLTANPLDKVTTGAYVPFGTPTTAGQVIPGRLPCNGAILRVPAAGGPLELVAWGFRNPFSLAFAPDGRLFATENSYDVRGSRPVFSTGDLLWCVQPGLWYGWPDFWAGEPLIEPRFRPQPGLKPQPQFLLAQHPNCPPKPVARLGVRSSSDGLDFSRNPAFGHVGEAFIAVYGDHTGPGMGRVDQPVGFRVVRVNVQDGVIEDFLVNKAGNGPASKVGGGGLERPVDVRFNTDGTALYVVDFGVMTASLTGPKPHPGTGVLWRVRPVCPPTP